VTRQTVGTLKSSDFDSLSALNTPLAWYQSYCMPNLEHSLPRHSENYLTIASSPSRLITEISPGAMAPLRHSTTIELFSPFKLIIRFDLGFRAIPRAKQVIVSPVAAVCSRVVQRRHNGRYLRFKRSRIPEVVTGQGGGHFAR
jgi:hypothetical protein